MSPSRIAPMRLPHDKAAIPALGTWHLDKEKMIVIRCPECGATWRFARGQDFKFHNDSLTTKTSIKCSNNACGKDTNSRPFHRRISLLSWDERAR